MKKTLIVLGIVSVLLASVLLLSTVSELKIESGYSYTPDITTDKVSYIPSDTIAFTIRLLERDVFTGATKEMKENFTLSIEKDNPYALLTTKTGKSPMTFQYPASSLNVGDNGLSFYFCGIVDSRSFTEPKDVLVTQTREADVTPPTLAFNGMVGVSVFQQAEVRFSEPVKTLTSNNFFITGVAGTILQTGVYAILTPATHLDYNTQYTVHLSGVQDIAGNAMADFSWNFNVAGDGTPPEVQIEYPIAILKSGFDLRQADVYDVSYKDYRMANAGVAYNNVLTVTGNAYDYSGISSVRCKNDANGEITTGSGGSQWSVGVNLVPDSNQNYITVYVKDSNGNEGQDRILVHYSTGGIQLIDIVFNQPTSIGSKGNGAFITDEQFVNVSGHATYTYRNIVKVSWNNNLTGIGGIVWTGSSHDLNWSFNARLKNGENPIWVTVEEEHGGKNYGAFTATSHYMEITTSADPTSVQLFNEVRFASTVDGGAPSFTYEWQFGDSSSSADANPTHTYATTGTFVVSLTVTDSHSTVRNSTVSVTVTTAPTPPQPFDGKQWFVSYGWIIGAVVGFIGAALSFIPVVPKPIKKVGYIFLFAFGVIIGFWILLVSITPI